MSNQPPTIAELLLDQIVASAPQHARDTELAIEAHGLVKHFGDIHAVNGIDLRVRPGPVFGFLGQHGSGKTTTGAMLTPPLRPTEGSARVAGFDIYSQDRQVRRAIGVALQEAGLDILQTGRELLRLQSRLYNVPRGEIEARVSHLLEVVDLSEDADRRIGGYSAGMQRRLDLASALVHSPSIIFLDEPTTGLHFEDIRKLLDVLHALVEAGNTVVVIEHNLDVIKTADWIIDLGPEGGDGGGEVIAQGTPEEIAAAPGSHTGAFLAPYLGIGRQPRREAS